MIRFVPLAAAVLIAFAAASTPAASMDVEIRSGDKVTGTLDPASQHEIFRFRCPQNAVISVKAKAARHGPSLELVLKDPSDAQITEANGTKASIKGVTTATSGLYSVDVSSHDGISTGDYALTVTWKSRPRVVAAATLPAGGEGQIVFPADVESKPKFTVKPAKGSGAKPVLVRLEGPNSYNLPLASSKGAAIVLPFSGDYTLVVRDTGATGGDIAATIDIKPGKHAKRTIVLTSEAIDSGESTGDRAIASVIGSDGGLITVPPAAPGEPGAAIAGSSVLLPPGALPGATAIVIATAPGFKPAPGLQDGGPAVFFGPEGLKFGKQIKITIPFDAGFTESADLIQIYTRDAKGKVSLVPKPYDVNVTAHTISFPADHFSSYAARIAADIVPVPPSGAAILTIAQIGDPRDVCQAQDNNSENIVFYVAEGSDRTVGALRVAATATVFERVLYAGGGTSSDDGTQRLEFQFPEPVQTVYSNAVEGVGTLYVGCRTRLYEIEPSGEVVLIAGTGVAQDSGDGAAAILASFVDIADVVVDQFNNIYVADSGAHKIRVIDASTTIITTYAGSGLQGVDASDGFPPQQSAFVGPAALMVQYQSFGLYVADGGRVREISLDDGSGNFVNRTVAGSMLGTLGSSGDGGAPTAALFQSISSVQMDFDLQNPEDNVIMVSDAVDHTIRRLDLTANTVTLIAGTHGTPGLEAEPAKPPSLLNTPTCVFPFVTFFFICDQGNGRLRMLTLGN